MVQNEFLEIPVIPHATEFDDGYDVKLWLRSMVPNNWNWKISQQIKYKLAVFALHLCSQGRYDHLLFEHYKSLSLPYVILHFRIPDFLSFSETCHHNLGLSWFYAVSTKNGGVIAIKIFYNKLLVSDKC